MNNPPAEVGLKFAPNLSWLFTEVPFLERFAQAAAAGFTAVEFLFPYEAGIEAVQARLAAEGLTVALFNLPPGDTAAGEFGLLGVPARCDAFKRGFEQALTAAQLFGCRRLHTMAGKRVAGLPWQAQLECALENLAWAAPQAAAANIDLLIEALNPTDMPDYLLHTSAQALALVRAANQPNVKLQYDVYHAQMTEGNLTTSLKSYFSHLGHLQIADVPGRHQPGSGEINYPHLFKTLKQLQYNGYIGLEYRPAGTTLESLAWLPPQARPHRLTQF